MPLFTQCGHIFNSKKKTTHKGVKLMGEINLVNMKKQQE